MDIIGNSVLKLLYEHRYIFVFLGALFEGNFIMILSGVLFRFGYFDFLELALVLTVGYFLNGIFWYLLGRIAGYVVVGKWIKRFRPGRKLIDRLEGYFQKHDTKTIFLTRITYGFSMLSFMVAGSLKMNFKKFLTVSFVAAIGWVIIMTGLGYGFGVGFQSLSKVAKGITVGISVAVFILIILISLSFIYWMRYFARTKFVQELENHDSYLLSKIGGAIRKAFHRKEKNT